MTKNKKAFTLVEVMIAVSIFAVVMALVLSTIINTFRSTERAKNFSKEQQEVRFVFFRIGKEINSIVKFEPPRASMQAEKNSFFLPSRRMMR